MKKDNIFKILNIHNVEIILSYQCFPTLILD